MFFKIAVRDGEVKWEEGIRNFTGINFFAGRREPEEE